MQAKALGVRQEAISKDLMLYKGILSKLSAAKDLMCAPVPDPARHPQP